MKNLRPIIILFLSLFAIESFAQPACTVKYQAVARDADDNVYPNREIGVQFSIMPGPVYVEQHTTTTTSLGHFYLELGGGDPQMGNFEGIDWSLTEYSLQIEVDLDGGTDYEVLGESPILSVPVALWAKNTNYSSFAEIADSVIKKPEIKVDTILGECGNEIHLDYCGNVHVFPDADADNELINSMTLDGKTLVVNEGAKQSIHLVDLSSLMGPGGDSKWICQGDSMIYMANDSVKFIFEPDGYLTIFAGPNSLDVSPLGIIFDDIGGIIYDPEENTSQLVTDFGEIDTLMSLKMFSKFACFDSLDIGDEDTELQIYIGPDRITFDDSLGFYTDEGSNELDGYLSFLGVDTISVGKILARDVCTDTFKITDVQGAHESAYVQYYNVLDSINRHFQIISQFTTLDEDATFEFAQNIATDAYWTEYFNVYNNPVVTLTAGETGGEVTLTNRTGEKVIFSAGPMDSNPDVGIAESDVIMADTLKGQILCIDSIKIGNAIITMSNIPNDENFGMMRFGTPQVPEAYSIFTRQDANMPGNIFSTSFGQANLVGQSPQHPNIQGVFHDPISETNIITIDQIFKGVSNFSIPNPKNADERIVYACIEGPEAAAYERGEAKLVNGEAFVEFSTHFRDIINFESMTIQLTPGHWDTYGLAVIEKTENGFKVKELKGGQGNFSFDWEVKAVRSGFENYRVIRSNEDYMFQTTDDLEKARDKMGK